MPDVKDLLVGTGKFIVFAHHRDVLNGLEHAYGSPHTTQHTTQRSTQCDFSLMFLLPSCVGFRLESNSVDYIRIDGSTQSKHRQMLVDHFQDDAACRVAILSITAAG